MSSSFVWPRHEVLQLINPSFAQSGRTLTNSLAVEASRHLAKMQSPDRSISFEQWHSVATEFLKWNEHCVRLFWDMLHISTWYKQSSEWSQNSDFVNIGYLVVFLVMHSTNSSRPLSPTRHSAYESVWPLENAPVPRPEGLPLSPPMSPEKGNKKVFGDGGSNTTPLSPRSPRQSSSPIRSPMRGLPGYKSSAQHISFVREKLSTVVHALSLQDTVPGEHSESEGPGSRRPSEDSISSDKTTLGMFASTHLSQASMDAMGLVLGGGDDHSEVRNLSSLFPVPPTEFDDDCGAEGEDESGVVGSRAGLIGCSEAIEWVETHLQLNEYMYPPCPISATGSLSSGQASPVSSPRQHVAADERAVSGMMMMGMEGETAGHHLHSAPSRKIVPLSSPHAREPFCVVNGSSSTIFHILTMGKEEAGSDVPVPSKLRSISGEMVLSSPGGGMTSVRSEDDLLEAFRHTPSGQGRDESASPNTVNRQFGLAQLHGCMRMTIYLLGAYSTVNISSCIDCEIVVGAVAGSIVMNSCERVRVTVACRKMVLWSCHDCDIRLATLTPTLLTGDCRKLVFGPHNTTYRLFRMHLRLAQLDSLISSSHIAAAQNCWHEVFDVGTCADTPTMSPPGSTPSSPRVSVSTPGMSGGSHTFLSGGMHAGGEGQGGAGGGLSSGLVTLPKPPESISSLQNPDKFSFLSIPYQPEFQPLEMSPCITPERYMEAYMRKKQNQGDVQRQIADVISRSKGSGGDSADTFGKAMSQQFLEWLVQTGKSQQLLDLVRLDAEDSQHNASDSSEVAPETTHTSRNKW